MEKTNPAEMWPSKTVLIIGDSMLNQMDNQRLSSSTKRNIEVRSFGGASINSLYEKLDIILKKKPTTVILHVGTNDSTTTSSDILLDELLKLKHFIESENIEVVISCPIMRIDDNKANLTIKRLNEKVKQLEILYMINTNIDVTCLGKKGHHLNRRGVGRFAANLISLVQKL